MWRVALLIVFGSSTAIADEGVMISGSEMADGIAEALRPIPVDEALQCDQVQRLLSEAMDRQYGATGPRS